MATLDTEIKTRLEIIFRHFEFQDEILPVDVNKIFTKGEYIEFLSIMHRVSSLQFDTPIAFSTLTEKVKAYMKGVVQPYVEAAFVGKQSSFFEEVNKVVAHFLKLEEFVARFYSYVNKKDVQAINILEHTSTQLFHKILFEQVFFAFEAKILFCVQLEVAGVGRRTVGAGGPLSEFLGRAVELGDAEEDRTRRFFGGLRAAAQAALEKEVEFFWGSIESAELPEKFRQANKFRTRVESNLVAMFPARRQVFEEVSVFFREVFARRAAEVARASFEPEAISSILEGGNLEDLREYRLFLSAIDPSLRSLQPAFEGYLRKRISEALESGGVTALEELFISARRLVAELGNPVALRSATTACLEWLLSEDSKLSLSPARIRLALLQRLKDLVAQGRLEADPLVDAFLLEVVPFVPPAMFDKLLATFFTKFALDNIRHKNLNKELAFANDLARRIGEELCKKFLSVFAEAKEPENSPEILQRFLEDAGQKTQLSIATVAAFNLGSHATIRSSPEFESFQTLYETFFNAQKQNSNKLVSLNFELGNCEIELPLHGQIITIECCPLEAVIISAVYRSNGLSLQEIFNKVISDEMKMKDQLVKNIASMLEKMRINSLVDEIDEKFYKPTTFKGNSHIQLNAVDFYQIPFDQYQAEGSTQKDKENRLASAIMHHLKVHKSASIQDLIESLGPNIQGLDLNVTRKMIAELLKNGLVKRSKSNLEFYEVDN